MQLLRDPFCEIHAQAMLRRSFTARGRRCTQGFGRSSSVLSLFAIAQGARHHC